MSKNLVENESLEFYEGTELSEHIAAIIEAGETVEIVPFDITSDRTIPTTGERTWLATLPHEIDTSVFTKVELHLTVFGLEGGNSADTVVFTPRIVGVDGNNNAVVKTLSSFKPVCTVGGAYFPTRCDDIYTLQASGAHQRYLIGYQNGSFTTYNSKNTSTNILPPFIRQVGVYFDNLPNIAVKTNGIIAVIRGIR